MKLMNMHPAAIEYLSRIKLLDGKFDPRSLAGIPLPEGIPQRVNVVVRPMAFVKMEHLIRNFTTEIGWHGICKRSPSDDSTYIIEDVFVYPPKVTGTNITTDETKHGEWLNTFPDEVFNHMRFHGHSHVNMGVFSSGTDDDLQRDLISMLVDPNDFYLFFIMNKRMEVFVRLYDNKFGVVYETKDVTVTISDGETDLDTFMKDSRSLVTTVTYTPTTTGNQTSHQGNTNSGSKSNAGSGATNGKY